MPSYAGDGFEDLSPKRPGEQETGGLFELPIKNPAIVTQAVNEMFYHLRLPPDSQPIVERGCHVGALREEST
jgi:hypothetical protein